MGGGLMGATSGMKGGDGRRGRSWCWLWNRRYLCRSGHRRDLRCSFLWWGWSLLGDMLGLFWGGLEGDGLFAIGGHGLFPGEANSSFALRLFRILGPTSRRIHMCLLYRVREE
jgi:hypothetical protein